MAGTSETAPSNTPDCPRHGRIEKAWSKRGLNKGLKKERRADLCSEEGGRPRWDSEEVARAKLFERLACTPSVTRLSLTSGGRRTSWTMLL